MSVHEVTDRVELNQLRNINKKSKINNECNRNKELIGVCFNVSVPNTTLALFDFVCLMCYKQAATSQFESITITILRRVKATF